jgi:hypothetical protein
VIFPTKDFFNWVRRLPSIQFEYRLDTQRITGPQPQAMPFFFKKGSGTPTVLKLRRFLLATSLATRCRALFGARPRRTGSEFAKARTPRRPSHMTIDEVEDVVRALTAVVENLEAGAAKQSMQEAFMQVRAYAGETRAPAGKGRSGNDRPKPDLLRMTS